MQDEVGAIRGSVDAAAAEDFPGLALWSIACSAPSADRDHRGRRSRLEQLDDRVREIAVGSLRTHSVAGAYRAFARQIGLDPDVERNPLDQAAVERLNAGRFVARGPLSDALLIAMLETSVPLWALDGKSVSGCLHVHVDAEGRLAIADAHRSLAPLLAQPPGGVVGTESSSELIVYALRVDGVPTTTVAEAFWHMRPYLLDKTL